MRVCRQGLGIALLACCRTAAQQPVPTPSPAQLEALHKQERGVESPAEARQIVEAVLRDREQMKPLLEKLDPKAWYEKKGAPSTYVIQWQTAQRELEDVNLSARAYQSNLDDLSAGLDLYFRLEALETTARSLDEGAQRYDNPVNAGLLGSLVAHNFDSRERFREYLRGVARNLQQSYKIADDEAQRCRAAMTRQTPCASGAKRAK